MRRPIRSTRALGALLALTASTVACSANAPAESSEHPGTVASSTAPTTAVPAPVADQTPPLGTFGLAFHDEQLWVVDFYRGQVLAVDPDSGTIVKRLESQDGVSAEVSDVSVRKDGTIFWLGYNDGGVSVLSGNEYKTFAQVTPGTYSMALSPDGQTLYAAGAVGHPGYVWTVDLTKQEQPRKSASMTTMRSFDVGPDGRLYAPRFGAASARPGLAGALLQVDPVTGAPVELVGGLDGPIAVKLSRDGTTAHVLCLPPGGKPSVTSIDLASRTRRPAVELRTPLADNLAVADDGRIFVSSYNDSLISVIGTDGQVKTLHIGQPAPTRS